MSKPFRIVRYKDKRRPIAFEFPSIYPGKRISSGMTDEISAIRWAERFYHDHSSIPDPMAKTKTFVEYARGAFSEKDPLGIMARLSARGKHFGPTRQLQMAGRLHNWVLPKFGPMLITAISRRMIEDWFLAIPRGGDTKNKSLQCLSMILDSARRDGIIASNPAEGLAPASDKPQHPRRIFSDKEIAVLFPNDAKRRIEIWGGLDWAGYFSVLLDTGFRPGEASAISVDNFFPQHRGIYIKKDVDPATHEVRDRIKTSNDGQAYKISNTLSDTTMTLLEQCSNAPPDGYLFGVYTYRTGRRRIIPDTANKHMRMVCAHMGIDLGERTQYSFRHTFDTNQFGRIPEDVRHILMGHTRERKEYLHVTPEKGFKLLDDLMLKQ